MNAPRIFSVLLLCCVPLANAREQAPAPTRYAAGAEHVVVYQEPGRYGGWPANHGMWAWGDELLVGFSRGYYKDRGTSHHIDTSMPEEHALARSLDGGRTWALERPNEKGDLLPETTGRGLHGTELPGVPLKPWADLEKPMDFAHPDFAMTLRMQDNHGGDSRFYYSYDRGRTWNGPFKLPRFGLHGAIARTEYLIDGPRACTIFMTAAKQTQREGTSFSARTTDGGLTWEYLGAILNEPDGYAIMPAAVRLDETSLLAVVRERGANQGPSWLSVFRSRDNGRTWKQLPRLADTGIGNPAALVKLADGRVAAIYGYRAEPYSIVAKITRDNGETWSDPITLRDDGADRDIGYPRATLRADGKIVATYYFNDKSRRERYIAATIWDPDGIVK